MNVIWIHGFGENSIVWKDFIKSIKGQFTHHLYDFSEQTSHQNIRDYAIELHNYILANNIEKPVLIGHSMGGYIGVEYAAKFTSNISGLGLFHSSAKADSESKKADRLKTIGFIERNGAEAFIKNYYRNLFAEKNQSKFKEIIDFNTNELLDLKGEALVTALTSMMNRNENYTTLEALTIPVFQILGKLDPFVLLEDGLDQTRLLAKPYTLVLDNVSHAGMYEATEICAQFISHYLSEI